MSPRNRKPTKLVQNRPAVLLESAAARLQFYREMLQRRIAEAENAERIPLLVPQRRGMRLRLPGKPFHPTPEIFFQESGVNRFTFPEGALVSRPGSVALIPAGLPHGEAWSGRAFLNVIVTFHERGFSLRLGYLDEINRTGPIDQFSLSAQLSLIRYAEEIAAAPSTETGRRLRRGLYLAFLARLVEGMDAGALDR